MSSKLSSEFGLIKHNFELYTKLVPLHDDWSMEYSQRLNLDLHEITHGYDDTIVRNVRNKDEKFCYICPEICQNELEWDNLLRHRMDVLSKRIKYVHDLERILQLKLERFKRILESSTSPDEVEKYSELLKELGPLPTVDPRK